MNPFEACRRSLVKPNAAAVQTVLFLNTLPFSFASRAKQSILLRIVVGRVVFRPVFHRHVPP